MIIMSIYLLRYPSRQGPGRPIRSGQENQITVYIFYYVVSVLVLLPRYFCIYLVLLASSHANPHFGPNFQGGNLRPLNGTLGTSAPGT